MTIIDTFNGKDVIEEKTLDTKVNTSQPFIDGISDEWITFGNIKCYDAKSNIFEAYTRVQLARNFCEVNGGIPMFGIQDAIPFYESRDLFLPSCALTAQCLVTLYHNRDDADCLALLLEYFGLTSNSHVQNTLVDQKSNAIIHYPQQCDFGGTPEPNKLMERRELPYTKMPKDDTMAPEYTSAENVQFMRSLTGLKDVSILEEIAQFASTWHRFRFDRVDRPLQIVWESRQLYAPVTNLVETARATRIPQ